MLTHIHTITHALEGCGCPTSAMFQCVVCGKTLVPWRQHTDTCGAVCFKSLLVRQRNYQAVSK